MFGVDDESLVVRRNVNLLRPELTHVEAQAEHLAASAALRAVVEHVAEIHLFQQVFTAAAAAAPSTIVCRLQPEEVIAQARYLPTTISS